MRDWRKTRISVGKDSPFHVKPFVNQFVRARFRIKEEDGAIIVLYDGNPLSAGEIGDWEEAEHVIDTLCGRVKPLSALLNEAPPASRHLQGDGEFAEG